MVRTFVLVVCGALMLGGCVPKIGRDFQKPSNDSLVLGQTTIFDIEGRLGQPLQRKTETFIEATEDQKSKLTPFDGISTDSTRTSLGYLYGAGQQRREISFGFVGDKLGAYIYRSDFPNDSTDFDMTKVSLIRRNVTTEAEAIAIFGPIDGRAIYPFVRDPQNHIVRYYFNSTTGTHHESKQLALLVDSQNRVVDYKIDSRSEEVPLQVAPAPVTVPIFIPKGK